MAEAFFVAGLAANACVQAQGVTVSSEDAVFTKANLQNGDPSKPFRFGGLDVNPKIEFDCNIIRDPSFETEADGFLLPTANWKVPTGGGTPDVSTAASGEPDGTKSLRLNAASEAAYQDRIVRPGGTYRHSCQLHGDGTNIVSAYVLDLISGKWWNGSAWTTTKTAWATRTTASFAESITTFTLEDPVAGHVGPGRLRFLYERPGTIAGAAYVDLVLCWPKITMAALLFDTIPTGFTVAIQSDDNAAFSSPTTTMGNLPARRFRRYLPFAGPGTLERYWRFLVTGTFYDGFKAWVGQPMLAEREVFLTNQGYGMVAAREMPKVGTKRRPVSLAAAPQYRLDMAWKSSASSYQQVAEKLVGASFHGDEPVLIVPDIQKPEFVYGRGDGLASIASNWVLSDFYEYSVSVQDDAYPVAPSA